MAKFLVPCGMPLDITVEAHSAKDALDKQRDTYDKVAGLFVGAISIWMASGAWPENAEFLPHLQMSPADKQDLLSLVREVD